MKSMMGKVEGLRGWIFFKCLCLDLRLEFDSEYWIILMLKKMNWKVKCFQAGQKIEGKTVYHPELCWNFCSEFSLLIFQIPIKGWDQKIDLRWKTKFVNMHLIMREMETELAQFSVIIKLEWWIGKWTFYSQTVSWRDGCWMGERWVRFIQE